MELRPTYHSPICIERRKHVLTVVITRAFAAYAFWRLSRSDISWSMFTPEVW